MSFTIGIGGGKSVEVREPARTEFPANLGGAVEYTLAHAAYAILHSVGEGMGTLFAGFLVKFLEIVEPELVDYLSPILDKLLSIPNMPPEFRTFFEKLRNPPHEAGAAILAGLGQQAGGAVVGSVFQTILAPLTYALNEQLRLSLGSPSELYAMLWRGLVTSEFARKEMAQQGLPDALINGYQEILRPRVDIPGLIMAQRRGFIDSGRLYAEIAARGYLPVDVDLLYKLTTRVMDVDGAIEAMYRGLIPESKVRATMTANGYDAADIDTILKTARPMPGPPDLVRMAVREAYNDGVSAQWSYDEDYPAEFERDMSLQGFQPEWSRRYWRAHWELPSVTQGYEMLHRSIIDMGTLRTLLKVSDYPAFWREKLIASSYNVLTRVDVRRMYRLGVLTRDEVKRSYMDAGYNDRDAERLTQFTVKYEDPDGGSVAEKRRDLTAAMILTAYKQQVISRAETESKLSRIRYTPDDIRFMVALADTERLIDQKPDFHAEHVRDTKNAIEQAYYNGVVDRGTACSQLGVIGLSGAEAELSLSFVDYNRAAKGKDEVISAIGKAYVNRVYDRNQAISKLGGIGITGSEQGRLFAEWDINRDFRSDRLTEAQYRKAYNYDIIGLEDYQEAMRGMGYSERDVDILSRIALADKEG